MYGISRRSGKSHTSKKRSTTLPKACVERAKTQSKHSKQICYNSQEGVRTAANPFHLFDLRSTIIERPFEQER
jgi:hypothetical protein